jgi:CRP/FNR family transcriptional regulator, cyclic AMP receptor protein
MSLLSHLDLIRRIPIFSMLTDAEASLLSRRADKRRYKRGERLITQGERANALFVVLTGKVRVLVKDDREREVILSELQPGECVGEMSLIDNEPQCATVRADTVCDVLVLDSQAFAHCLAENPSFSYCVMRCLVKRLRRADRKIQSLALSDVYGRVATALIDMADSFESGSMVIRERISRQDVAKMIGASREMVSRVMKEFEKTGFIEVCDQGCTWIRRERRPAVT